MPLLLQPRTAYGPAYGSAYGSAYMYVRAAGRAVVQQGAFLLLIVRSTAANACQAVGLRRNAGTNWILVPPDPPPTPGP